MTHKVAHILEELREDHHNMALMLNMLELEAGRIHNGDEPEYELLHDIMSYMTVYADAVHHPKEDLIYTKLKSEMGELGADLERVTDDHRVIAALGLTLRQDFEAIVAGAAVTRDRVIADTLSYAGHLRHHMGWEEDDLFMRADEMVAKNKAVTVNASSLSAADPVFSETPQAAFDNLLRSILDAAKARGSR